MVTLIVSKENQDVLSTHVISVVTSRIMTNSVFDVDVGPVIQPHSYLLKKVIGTEATNIYSQKLNTLFDGNMGLHHCW
jgi:hypothetical protein